MTPLLVIVFGVAPQRRWHGPLVRLDHQELRCHGAWHRGRIDRQVLHRFGLGSIPAAMLALALIHFFPQGGLIRCSCRRWGRACSGPDLAICPIKVASIRPTTSRQGTDHFKRAQPGLTRSQPARFSDAWSHSRRSARGR